MSWLYTGNDLPKVARTVVRRHLEWPLDTFASNRDRFDRFGTKGGSLAGVITEATYVKPKGRATVAVALFMQDLPPADWMSFAQSFVHQRFMLKLVEDPGFRDEVRATLGNGM